MGKKKKKQELSGISANRKDGLWEITEESTGKKQFSRGRTSTRERVEERDSSNEHEPI